MKRLLFWAIALYLSAFTLMVVFQEHLIYPFDPRHMTPTQAGEPRLQEQILKTPDGEELMVWAAAAKGRKPTILYFHGNAGGLANRALRFDRLLDRGFGLVAMGYRGSSGSSGKPSEQALTADALLLRKSLAQLLPHKPKDKILYFGESLGTGVATKLASQIPPDALLLEAPYTSIEVLAAQSLPIFPTTLFLRNKWRTIDHIKSLKMPLFILHGTADRVVPYAHGQQVFQAATTKHKHMETLQGSGHTGLWNTQGQTALFHFISTLK